MEELNPEKSAPTTVEWAGEFQDGTAWDINLSWPAVAVAVILIIALVVGLAFWLRRRSHSP